MFLFLDRLFFLQYFMLGFHCDLIGPPQFESKWSPITAQSTASDFFVQHGLGTVPVMVEVLVRAVDGPNKGFIFKAMGHAARDDDNLDMYGGVIYMYNDVSVRVIAPVAYNSKILGTAIYTGEAPYWRGVNSQGSLSAEVKVRCWSTTSLPGPCVNITDRYIKAGSTNVDDTYIELNHNQTGYPALVKVRVKLLDGDAGWYSDAQGASQFNYLSMGVWSKTGGLKFAYNNISIRVWASSYPGGVLFSRYDGWGKQLIEPAISGYVEIFAWCDFVLSYEKKVTFGPLVVDENLQVPFPVPSTSFNDILISILVEAVDGPNKGYLFEGVGSAMPNTFNIGQPCAYGGLVYAYNDTTLRLWRPDHPTGAAICIPDNMGFGTNAQASQNGNLLLRVFISLISEPAEEYHEFPMVCNHFAMLGNDIAYNSTPIDTQLNVTTLLACNYICRQLGMCVTYSYHNYTCQMYNTTNDFLFYTQHDSQVWGLN